MFYLIACLEVAGQQQYLGTLNNKLSELKEEHLSLTRKLDFYEYMRDECNVDVKRLKIKNISEMVQKSKEQKGIISEKSRYLINQIKDVSRCIVISFNQRPLLTLSTIKLGKWGPQILCPQIRCREFRSRRSPQA